MRLRYLFGILAMVALVFGVSVCSDTGETQKELTDAERWQDYGEPTAPPSDAAIYKIASYNADQFDRGWYPGISSRPTRVKQHDWVANMMKTNAVDLLGIVECLDGIAPLPSMNNKEAHDLADLQSALTNISYPMPVGKIYLVANGDGKNCIAVCAKDTISITDYDAIKNAYDTTFTRAIYKYKVTFPGNNAVWFYSCHIKALEDGETGRKEEAKALARYIRANHDLKNDYVVVYGDMNTVSAIDWPGGVGLAPALVATNNPSGSPTDCTVGYLEMRTGDDPDEFFTSLTRKERYPQPTFMQGGNYALTNGLPLDHIILSPALYRDHYVPNSFKAIGSGKIQVTSDSTNSSAMNTYNPSDHLPVMCQLYF